MPERSAVDPGKEIDKLNDLRAERQALQKKADAAKEKENQQKARVMEILRSMNLDKASGKVITAALTSREAVKIVDREKFWRALFRAKAPHWVENRPSNPSLLEEIHKNRRGKPVPGTEIIEIEDLSVTKR